MTELFPKIATVTLTLDLHSGLKICSRYCCIKHLCEFISKSVNNKASQAIQSPRTVPFFLLVSLLDGYSFPNVLVKGIVAFEH